MAQPVPVKGGSWVQDPDTGEFVPKAEYYRNKSQSGTPMILGNMEAFKSPIDGRMISDRGQLRKHNQEHGVTDPRDYGAGYFARKEKERAYAHRSDTPEAVRERKKEINTIIERGRYEH